MLTWLPFVSGLHELEPSHFRSAGKEVLVTVLLATFPLWAGAFYGALSDMNSSGSGWYDSFRLYLSKLEVNIGNGTLILYSASLIAPVLYIALKEKKEGRRPASFPSPMAHILSVFMIQTAATIYFTKQMSSELVNPNFAYYSSIAMFLFTVFVLYVVHCYRHFDDDIDPVQAMDDGVTRFTANYHRHRKGQE